MESYFVEDKNSPLIVGRGIPSVQISRGIPKECLVSVVIATWKRREELRKTLLEYGKQSYPHVEIIVVDNNSCDGTVELLGEEFPNVRLIRLSENTGVKAYNIGMQAAKGDILVISDNDSHLEPSGIEKIVQKFREGDEHLAVVACEVVYLPQNSVYHWYPLHVDAENPDPRGYPSHLFIGAGAAIRREVLERIGCYPEEFFLYMNEVDLCTRIIGAGYDVRYFPDIVTYHRWTEISRVKGRSRLLSFRNAIWYYWKYFPIHIALGRSLIRIPFEVLVLSVLGTNPLDLMSTLAEILGRIPRILRNRTPIPKKHVKRALGYQSEISNLYYFLRENFSRHKLAGSRSGSRRIRDLRR